MSLDYSKGCVNFRNVGEWVGAIAAAPLLARGRILRGCRLDSVSSAAEIGNPGTIVNLRKGVDPEATRFGVDHFHFPISNDHEKYETRAPQVRRWLGSASSGSSAARGSASVGAASRVPALRAAVKRLGQPEAAHRW